MREIGRDRVDPLCDLSREGEQVRMHAGAERPPGRRDLKLRHPEVALLLLRKSERGSNSAPRQRRKQGRTRQLRARNDLHLTVQGRPALRSPNRSAAIQAAHPAILDLVAISGRRRAERRSRLTGKTGTVYRKRRNPVRPRSAPGQVLRTAHGSRSPGITQTLRVPGLFRGPAQSRSRGFAASLAITPPSTRRRAAVSGLRAA